jgi:hypothetical protein
VVYLVLNTQDGTTSIEDADGSYTEADMDMELGYWVGLVDIDGDGHADLAIGDAADERGGSEAGAILVVPGSSVGHYLVEDAVEWVLAGSVGDGVGLAAGIGDADGDGAEDMLVGVTSSRENLGGFYVVRTPAAGVTTLAVETPWFAGPETWDCVSSWYGCGLAYSAETLGGGHDLTGDGLEDWAVAAPYAEWESSSDGAILIWSGAEL